VATPAVELTVPGPNGPRAIRVSNPDKLYFPELGVTKSDVVRYFLAVGDGILDALRDRPTTLERWPGGVRPGAKLTVWGGGQGEAFYQKRLPKGAPDWVRSVRVEWPNGGSADVVCPTELAVVAWAASLGTLTFHPGPSRRPRVDRPDRLQIDLDPQAGTGFRDAALVAVELRGLLGELGMTGFPKTSGGRGVHVYVPIEQRWTLDEVSRAVYALSRELHRRMPRQVTLERFKRDRGERVLLDYGQMVRTVASAYSIRPNPRATVSAPLTWAELTDAAPEDFTVTTMAARYADVGDPHAGMAALGYSIEPLLELADRDGGLD
jgi:DNA ligase D-like protein (predicted polymerase)